MYMRIPFTAYKKHDNIAPLVDVVVARLRWGGHRLSDESRMAFCLLFGNLNHNKQQKNQMPRDRCNSNYAFYSIATIFQQENFALHSRERETRIHCIPNEETKQKKRSISDRMKTLPFCEINFRLNMHSHRIRLCATWFLFHFRKVSYFIGCAASSQLVVSHSFQPIIYLY